MSTDETLDMESRILEAAKRVFVRKGFEATTMSDVAAEAGIGRTALHYYYRTKQMLFDAILGRLMDVLLPNIERIMKSEGTMLDKFPQIIDQYVEILRNNLSLPLFIINELNRDPGHVYQTVLKDPQRIQPILLMRVQIEEEMEKGIIRKYPLIDIMSSVVGQLIFPLLVRNPLSLVFMGGDMELYMEAYMQRKELVKYNLLRMLTPDGAIMKSETN